MTAEPIGPTRLIGRTRYPCCDGPTSGLTGDAAEEAVLERKCSKCKSTYEISFVIAETNDMFPGVQVLKPVWDEKNRRHLRKPEPPRKQKAKKKRGR